MWNSWCLLSKIQLLSDIMTSWHGKWFCILGLCKGFFWLTVHSPRKGQQHYDDVIMTTIASQITSLTVVYSIVYSDADERNHQSSASLAFVWGIHRDRWIPRTKGQLRGKCFHLMTSSWSWGFVLSCYHGQGIEQTVALQLIPWPFVVPL